MELPTEIRAEADHGAAVEAELAAVNRLLPPRWGDLALRSSADEVAAWLRAGSRKPQAGEPEDVVLARKVGRGARPLSILSLRDRLLYRMLTDIIQRRLGAVADRSHEAHQEFVGFPLTVDSCEYVVKTDIAAFYQYVDHDRLIAEVVAQTGDDLAIAGAVELLQEVGGRTYGLPQLSLASDLLGEVYIDPMRRDLARAGYEVVRFADDFRIACGSYQQALGALERADEAARALGLVLNEQKTSTFRRDTYQQSLASDGEHERELVEQMGLGDYADLFEVGAPIRLIDQSDFEETETLPPFDTDERVTPEQVAAAYAVLTGWAVNREETASPEAGEQVRMLKGALRILTVARQGSVLEHVPPLLVYEPSLTPELATYLVACAGQDRIEVTQVLDSLCTSGVLSTWQSLWVAWAAGSMSRRRRRGLDYVKWLRRQLDSPRPALAAEACVALARRGLIRTARVAEVLDRLPALYRPTAVVALGIVGDQAAAAKYADSQLDRLRFGWAAEHL